jgi:hypothetical protein
MGILDWCVYVYFFFFSSSFLRFRLIILFFRDGFDGCNYEGGREECYDIMIFGWCTVDDYLRTGNLWELVDACVNWIGLLTLSFMKNQNH